MNKFLVSLVQNLARVGPNVLLLNVFPFKDLDVVIQMSVLSIKGDPFLITMKKYPIKPFEKYQKIFDTGQYVYCLKLHSSGTKSLFKNSTS